VANPVEHEVPAPKELERPAAPEPTPTPEAIPVEPQRKTAPKRQERAEEQKSAPEKPQNQVPSTTGARASDAIFQAQNQGAGGVGIQGRNPFGQGFAWYATALQRRLSEEWSKTLGQSAPSSSPVVVQFRIARDGSVDRIRVVESSGNRSFDYSAHKAVQYINPFRPLPPGLRRDSINVEMRFHLN
jgi:TonB family protein